jgi:hypothetical protein
MRNGFGFSPKTLMHLASVVVRYNAKYASSFNNYIDGLRKLKDVDEFLMTDEMTPIRQFCNQFVRNHANNRQLVPNIDAQDKTLVIDTESSDIEFEAPIDEEYRLSRIMLGEDNPYGFITITKKTGNKLSQELYELVEVAGDKTFIEDGKTKVRYRKSNRLGLTNNFIEYNANDVIETSYFEDIRNESIDDMDDEMPAQGTDRSEQERPVSSPDDAVVNPWDGAAIVMRELEGPQKGKEGKSYRNKLRDAYKSAKDNSELKRAVNSLISAEASEKQSVMDRINEIFKEQNKC